MILKLKNQTVKTAVWKLITVSRFCSSFMTPMKTSVCVLMPDKCLLMCRHRGSLRHLRDQRSMHFTYVYDVISCQWSNCKSNLVSFWCLNCAIKSYSTVTTSHPVFLFSLFLIWLFVSVTLDFCLLTVQLCVCIRLLVPLTPSWSQSRLHVGPNICAELILTDQFPCWAHHITTHHIL